MPPKQKFQNTDWPKTGATKSEHTNRVENLEDFTVLGEPNVEKSFLAGQKFDETFDSAQRVIALAFCTTLRFFVLKACFSLLGLVMVSASFYAMSSMFGYVGTIQETTMWIYNFKEHAIAQQNALHHEQRMRDLEHSTKKVEEELMKSEIIRNNAQENYCQTLSQQLLLQDNNNAKMILELNDQIKVTQQAVIELNSARLASKIEGNKQDQRSIYNQK